MMLNSQPLRKTSQFLIPEIKQNHKDEEYDIYPSFRIDDNMIAVGYENLAATINDQKIIVIEGTRMSLTMHGRSSSYRQKTGFCSKAPGSSLRYHSIL